MDDLLVLLAWQVGGLVLGVVAVVVRDQIRRSPLPYLPPIVNTAPPTVALGVEPPDTPEARS